MRLEILPAFRPASGVVRLEPRAEFPSLRAREESQLLRTVEERFGRHAEALLGEQDQLPRPAVRRHGEAVGGFAHGFFGHQERRRYAATLAFRKLAFKADSYSLPDSPANGNQYAYMTERARHNRENFLLLAQLIDVGGASLLCTDSDWGKRQYHYYERLFTTREVPANLFAVLPKGKTFATGTVSGQRIGQKPILPLRCTDIPAAVRTRFGIEEFPLSATLLPSAGCSTSIVVEGSFAGSNGGTEGDRTVSWETVEDTREAVPGDCAASIIAAANRTYYDISLVLTGQESNPFYCKRDIEIPEIGASSPIQGVTHDILQERVTLQAGPPAQISVQDYLTIAG